jgi:hypothetical protein
LFPLEKKDSVCIVVPSAQAKILTLWAKAEVARIQVIMNAKNKVDRRIWAPAVLFYY